MFENVTDSPALIVIVAGMKQFGSQPGVDEPRSFRTVFGSDDGDNVGSDSVAYGSGEMVTWNVTDSSKYFFG